MGEIKITIAVAWQKSSTQLTLSQSLCTLKASLQREAITMGQISNENLNSSENDRRPNAITEVDWRKFEHEHDACECEKRVERSSLIFACIWPFHVSKRKENSAMCANIFKLCFRNSNATISATDGSQVTWNKSEINLEISSTFSRPTWPSNNRQRSINHPNYDNKSYYCANFISSGVHCRIGNQHGSKQHLIVPAKSPKQ